MLMPNPSLSLVIIQYGPVDLLRNLLRSLRFHPDSELIQEVIVVDNGCSMSEETRHYLQHEFASLKMRFVENSSNSYAAGVNRGMRVSSGDIVILSNNDVEWLRGWSVDPAVRRMVEDGRVGIGGVQLVYPDGSWQRSFGEFPSVFSAMRSALFLDALFSMVESYRFRRGHQRTKGVGYIDGAFMLVRRDCFDQLGGFDEAFSFYGEETDFCYRAIRSGWRVVFEPRGRVMHIRGASSSIVHEQAFANVLVRSIIQFVRKHHGAVRGRVYRTVMAMALGERVLLYNVLAKVTRASAWTRRARNARNLWMAALAQSLQ